MYKVGVYVPEQYLEEIKEALFEAGAGHFGDYDLCCWQTMGKTQFRPLRNSQPSSGKIGELIQITEYRIEMVCDDDKVSEVIKAIKKTHPYEQPAWDLVRLEVEIDNV